MQTKGIRVLVILLAAALASFAGRLWIRRFRRRLEGTPDLTQAIDLKRTTTIVTTVTNATRVLVWGTAGLFVLEGAGDRSRPAGPDYVAVEPTGGDDLLIRVQAETRPARRSEVERELQRKLNRRLLSLPRSADEVVPSGERPVDRERCAP